MHRVLAAHLGHHALEVALAVGHLGGGADDLQPDLVRAGEGDRVHARVLDERGADVALAGQQRRAPRAARPPRAAPGRGSAAQPGVCSAGLSSTALPVASAGGDHPERDRDAGSSRARSPRRRRAGSSAARCARPAPAAAARPGRGRGRRARSTRGSRSPRRRRRRPRATAWPPRGPRARRSRAAARAATPPRRRGSRRAARASSRPTSRAPLPAASASAASTSSGVAAAASATTRSGVPGSVEIRSSPSRRSSPIQTGTRIGGWASCVGERAGELRADRRAPQLEDRLVGELVHAGVRRGEQLLERHAAGLVVEERVVARVLQQPAHEVGHAGHEVADRAVGAHAQALGGDRLLQRVAEAAQDLQLDVGVVAAREPVVGDRVGDRAQVVRRDRRAQPAAVGAVVDQPARELLEVDVGLGLDLEHRRLPAVLGGLDDLVVPVGALHEPHGQRRRAAGAGAGDPLDDRVERLRRVAQVGLEHDAGRRARPGTPPRRAARGSARAPRRASPATPCRCAGARRAHGRGAAARAGAGRRRAGRARGRRRASAA